MVPMTNESLMAGEGINDQVVQWERDIRVLLERLEPYLRAGSIVTFSRITAEEKGFYEWLLKTATVPEGVCAVFVPPSVVQQAMWPGGRGHGSEASIGLYSIAPDAGAVVAVRCGSLAPIVNALFALPPMTPGIDVYERGRLLAGYAFEDHPSCVKGLSEAMRTHLR
jgi:hypothetical protein